MTPFRVAGFVIVGALGFAVQLATVGIVMRWGHLSGGAATALGVTAALVHNYAWHRRWTWGDRGRSASRLPRFVRFVAANGALSLVGNVAIVSLLVAASPIDAVCANAAAVAVCATLNFVVSDRFVFTPH